MKCSNCSEEIKPIVALDIDGTLGDYHAAFVLFAERYLGINTHKIRHYTGQGAFSLWMQQQFDIDLATYRQIKLAYRQGANKRFMPIFDGAQALCWSVRDAGAELWITTTRPYLSLDTVLPDTEFWLARHEIEFDGLLFDDDKYRVLAERVDQRRVVFVLDDILENVVSAQQHFPNAAWLCKGGWNFGVHYRQMCDLDSAADLALNAVETWYATQC